MRVDSTPIRAVAFDYGGVLAQFIDNETVSLMAQVSGVSFEKFSEALWKYRPQLDQGILQEDAYWQAVLSSCNSAHAASELFSLLHDLDTIGFSYIRPQLIRWVHSLKKAGFCTLIISNMAVAIYEETVRPRSWASLFDYHIISGLIGINKPDERIFSYAASQSNIALSEMLFLDDMQKNVEAAQSCTMKGYLFSRCEDLYNHIIQYYPYLPVDGLRM